MPVADLQSDPFSQAVALWKSHDVRPLPPLEEEEIKQAFTACGFPLSRDVIRLYAAIGGFEYGAMDDCWSLWSPERILEENEFNPTPYLWFADYLICSHYYGLEYQNAEVSSVYAVFNNDDVALVSDSVAEFLEKYVADPRSVEAPYLSNMRADPRWSRRLGQFLKKYL